MHRACLLVHGCGERGLPLLREHECVLVGLCRLGKVSLGCMSWHQSWSHCHLSIGSTCSRIGDLEAMAGSKKCYKLLLSQSPRTSSTCSGPNRVHCCFLCGWLRALVKGNMEYKLTELKEQRRAASYQDFTFWVLSVQKASFLHLLGSHMSGTFVHFSQGTDRETISILPTWVPHHHP